MRGVLLSAAIAGVFIVAPAQAQVGEYQGRGGCNKSIMWPFVRSAGDCLTDAEKRNGQTGVYGNPNAVLTPGATSGGNSGGGIGGFLGLGGGSRNETTASRGLLEDSIAPAPATAAAGAPAAAGTVASLAVAPPARPGALIARTDGGVPCTKGWFWPFSRSNGDCLTDVEKQNGQTGVYGNPNASAPAVVAAGAAAPAAANQMASLAVPPAVQATAAPVARTESTCTKGWLWPFHRNDGDCLTDVEKRNGRTGVYGNPNALPAPVVASVPAAPQPAGAPIVSAPALAAAPAATAATCTKGWFWPFTRSAGDCLTDIEKRNGQTGVYGNPNAAAAPAVASLPAAPMTTTAPAAAVAPVQAGIAPAPAATEATCTKGWFWPFRRSAGDCLTDIEKRNGQTGVYGNPNAASAPVAAERVAAMPVSAPAAAPASAAPAAPAPAVAETADAAACSKGWLWPFVRKAGDCPTDIERRNGSR